MVSTKAIETTIPAIEAKLKSFGGDMVKIEFLENCLKQLLQNDVKRFCHLKLADFYAYKLMWPLAAKNMDAAADCATTFKDKINFYLKEISYLIKIGDFLMIDKAFKKAMICGNNTEKEGVKVQMKNIFLVQAEAYEKRNQRSNAAKIYERLLEMPIVSTETEKRHLIDKLGVLNSKLGRLKEAVRYEMMAKRPIEVKRDQESGVKKVSFDDLGLEEVY